MDTSRIVIFGNSITRHSPAPNIGWFHDWGMAASDLEKDYVHIVEKAVKKNDPESRVRFMNIADYERDPKNFDMRLLDDYRNFRPTLLVFKILENVPGELISQIAVNIENLIDYILPERNADVVIVGSFWENEVGDSLLAKLSLEKGYTFISLKDIQSDAFRAIGEYEHDGVAAHPSDMGMAAIAEKIIKAIL